MAIPSTTHHPQPPPQPPPTPFIVDECSTRADLPIAWPGICVGDTWDDERLLQFHRDVYYLLVHNGRHRFAHLCNGMEWQVACQRDEEYTFLLVSGTGRTDDERRPRKLDNIFRRGINFALISVRRNSILFIYCPRLSHRPSVDQVQRFHRDRPLAMGTLLFLHRIRYCTP